MRSIAASASLAVLIATQAVAVTQAYAGDFTDAVDKITPSIVTVVSVLPQTGGGQLNYISSGVVVSEDGLILTFHEAIGGFEDISVRTSDGLHRPASVHATDGVSGFVLLKIDAAGLKPVEFADSDELKAGQYVLAAGSQYGVERNLAPSFSLGIIGGLKRYVPLIDCHHHDLIKTDAAMSPGSIGGPLVNAAGRVVGISVAICSNTGAWEGVGYAVPSNAVATIVEKLKLGGRFERGWLGVVIKADEPFERGPVIILSVNDGTPAKTAGLRAGDEIIALDGNPVEDSSALVDAVAFTQPGTRCIVTVKRGNETLEIPAVIGKRPPMGVASAQPAEPLRLPEDMIGQIEDVGDKLAEAIKQYVDQMKDPELAEKHREMLRKLSGINFKVISGSELQKLRDENRRLRERVEELERQMRE